jgi:hypothetical protein
VPGRAWVIALLLAVAAAGCGDAARPKAGLTNAQAQALVAQLETARSAAAAHSVDGTATAVSKFRASLTELRRAGALDGATARRLRIGVARLLARVRSDNPPPVQPPPVQTTPAPAPSPPGHAKHEKKPKPGNGNGNGKAKGHGHGHGGGGEGGD